MKLFIAQTTNANSSSFPVASAKNRFTSDIFTVYFWGTWDSATAKIQISPDGGTNWFDVPNTSVTADTVMNVEIRASHVRAVLSGGGGSMSLSVRLM